MRKTLILLVPGWLLIGLVPVEAGWDEGVAAFKAKNYQQAAQEFQQVVEQQPEEASGHQMLGNCYVALKDFKKAVSPLRKALELKSEDPGIRLALGQALFQLRSYGEVVQVLGKLDPASLSSRNQSILLQMRSVAYKKTGQEDRAMGDMKRFAALEPQNATAQFNYGTALFAAGDTRGAVSALEKASRLDAKDMAKKKAYVKALIRSARESRGAAKEAAYRKAEPVAQSLAGAQSTADNWLLLGEVQLGAKNYDGAISSLKRSTQTDPGNWLPYFYVGQALTAKGAYQEAVEPLTTAQGKTTLAADQKRIWGQLGYVYEKLKRFGESKTAYGKAGNSVAMQRVAENEAIAKENEQIDEHNKMVKELEEKSKALEEEIKALPGGTTPPR